MMSTTQLVDDDDVTEVTPTELGMLLQIRDAQAEGESIEEIRNAFEVACGLVEASMQGRLN